MKEKDLYIENKINQIILYAEKEDESYDAIKSGSYAVKHFLGDYFKLKENLDKELREELKKGNITPVYYYMLMQDMGPGDLAKRVGISKRKLRKHFRPDVFAKLDHARLQKYATVFGITVEQLKKSIFIKWT
jgi:hypothetical protein